MRNAQHQRAFAIQRAGEHAVAGRFLHGNVFAGNRRLVHGRFSRLHHRVGRNPLARTDENLVADGQISGINIDDVLRRRSRILHPMRNIRRECQQRRRRACARSKLIRSSHSDTANSNIAVAASK